MRRDIDGSEFVRARDNGHRAVAFHRQRADIGGHVDRRAAPEIPLVEIGAALNQDCGRIEVHVHQREEQRRHAVRIFGVRIGAGGEQILDTSGAAFARGIVQRGKAALVHIFRTRLLR